MAALNFLLREYDASSTIGSSLGVRFSLNIFLASETKYTRLVSTGLSHEHSIPFSHRKTPGPVFEAGLFLHPPAIRQGIDAAESTQCAIAIRFWPLLRPNWSAR